MQTARHQNRQRKGLDYPLTDVKTTINKWLRLKDDRVFDAVVATHLANRFMGDPTWLIIIGPPSSAKTEILRAFAGHPEAYFLSSLTPTTLVSGLKQKGNKDPSLLLQLDGRTLILKDFTSILAMRSENQQEILSQLREVYDGSYSKAFGNGKEVHWEGHVGLLGACTPVYDKHYAVIGSLGDRFLLYRTENDSGEEMGLMAQRLVGKEDTMRQELQAAVHRFIDQFNDLSNLHFESDDTTNKQIVTLATFCAHGRCPVDRDYRDGTVTYQPLPEGTPRLVKQFMQVGYGLALIHEKDRIDGELYEIIKKIGRDLLSGRRLKILEFLWQQDWLTKTSEVAEGINEPTNTVLRALEDLMIVGLVERTRAGEGEKAPYEWNLKDYCKDLLKGAEIFNVTNNEPF